MAIQVGGITVIDNTRAATNIGSITLTSTSTNLVGGDSQVYDSYGTISSGTLYLTAAGGNIKQLDNRGSFTLAADNISGLDTTGLNGCYTQAIYVNNGGGLSGTVTFSGFTKVTGDSMGTANARRYMLYYTRMADSTLYPTTTLCNYLHIVQIS